METEQIGLLALYVLLAGIVSLVLCRAYRPRHQFIAFLISLWILAEGILDTDAFVIPLGKEAGFELQFDRILLLVFGVILVQRVLWVTMKRLQWQSLWYEVVLFVAYLALLGVLIYHQRTSTLPSRDVLLIFSGWLTFLCFYFVVREYADDGLVRTILASILCVGLASSVVAVIQFAYDPQFLHVGSMREAFSGRVRSTGVFREEFSHSYFLIPGIMVAYTTIKRPVVRVVTLLLLLTGIFLSFHRMSWILAFIVLIAMGVFSGSARAWKYLGWILTGAAVVLILAVVGADYIGQASDLVYQRVTEDTMSGRMRIYDVALKRIQSVWLTGVGSEKTNAYYLDMTLAGWKVMASGEIGGLHNLYLRLAYMYGIPTACLFAAFLVSLAAFYWKRAREKYVAFLAAAYGSVFICANLTNALIFAADAALLLAIIAGLAAGMECRGIAFGWNERLFRLQG